VKLAIFDLDNTLLGGDSDLLWGEYLSEHGHIDKENHQNEHQRYYDDYKAGKLDINEFLEFQLRPLAENDVDTLLKWRNEYLEEKIKPIILEKATALLADHEQQDHQLLIITATNHFLTEPIADLMGVNNLIASNVEIIDGKYTGRSTGIPSYADGKVTRLKSWLEEQNFEACELWFYSDSHNDIPLLKYVDHPIIVDPDDLLKQEAEKEGWPIISLR